MAGLIAEFRRVASSDLSKNTVDTYICWIRKFHGFTKKGAASWSGRDITDFIHRMERDGYALKSRHQALCAIVYVFKRVLRIDPGNLELPNYATLVAIGAKTLETRSRAGKSAAEIHLLEQIVRGEHVHQIAHRHHMADRQIPLIAERPFERRPIAHLSHRPRQPAGGMNRQRGRKVWVLGNIVRLAKPIPARGALSLWEWSGR